MRTGVSPKRIATRIFWSCFLLPRAPARPIHKPSAYFMDSRPLIESFVWIHFGKQAFPLIKPNASALGSQQPNSNTTLTSSSLERRWSSRTFRYGYLVTTSPQLLVLPSAAPSLRLGHWLRALPTPMVWRAVCTRPGNVFTATFWFAITSDSSFM